MKTTVAQHLKNKKRLNVPLYDEKDQGGKDDGFDVFWNPNIRNSA